MAKPIQERTSISMWALMLMRPNASIGAETNPERCHPSLCPKLGMRAWVWLCVSDVRGSSPNLLKGSSPMARFRLFGLLSQRFESVGFSKPLVVLGFFSQTCKVLRPFSQRFESFGLLQTAVVLGFLSQTCTVIGLGHSSKGLKVLGSSTKPSEFLGLG